MMNVQRVFGLLAALMACAAAAWTSEAEMDAAVCKALSAGKNAWSPAFVGQLRETATNAACSAGMRCEASMLLSLNAWQCFLDTMDGIWMVHERVHAERAVEQIGAATNAWQYWMARFVRAGAAASDCDYARALSVLSNAVDRMAREQATNTATGVECAFLRLFDLPDVATIDAMRVLAGMSAAMLGDGNVATNFAFQVPPRYRAMILEALNRRRPAGNAPQL